MAKKFSGFSTSIVPDKTSTSQFIVGYSGQDNAQWTMKALADEIGGGDSIYTASSTIQSDRLVTFPTSGTLSFRVKNATDSKFNIGYEGGYGSISINPAKPIVGSVHRIEAAGVAMLSKYTAGNTLWFGNESNTNNSYGFNMGAAPNAQSSTVVTIKGQGLTGSTTALKVQNSDGDDIVKVLDDQTIGLGYNGLQITTEPTSSGVVKLNNISGAPLFSAGVVAGSTGKINVYGGFYNTFEYAASKGLVFTNQAGFNVSQDLSSMLTCVSSTKGFLPPRMTTTQRDAINSGTFTTGLTLYNTTDDKLQFYNGTAWTDAAGGDNIYTADGTITDTTRTIDVPQNGNVRFDPSTPTGQFNFYVNSTKISSLGEILIPSGGRFKINSFNTELRRNFLKLYGGAGACLNGTVDGYLTISSFGNADPSALYNINARLGVVGKGNTNATYGLRIQNVDEIDTFSVDDTGLVSVTGDTANSRLGLRFIPSNSAAGTGQYCKIQDTNGNDWIQKYQGAVSSSRSNILFVGKANGYASENNIVINGPGNVGAPSDNQTNIGDSSLWVWQGANIYGQYITGKTQDSTSTALLVRNWN
jgi:hypothetical protein